MAHPTVARALLVLALSALPAAFPQPKNPPPPVTSRELWTTIKNALAAQDGETYFKDNLKGALIPGAAGVSLFTGTLVSAEPPAQPEVLIVAISDAKTPELTLRLKEAHWQNTHLNGPLMPGSVIQFEGVASAFSKEPFMLNLDVSTTERSHIIVGRLHKH